MNYEESIIQKTAIMVKEKFSSEWSGHDRRHIYRVRQNALHIHKIEWWNKFVIELGALLHDIADYKFHGGDEYIWWKTARKRLESLEVSEDIIEQVIHIVDNISFKWANVNNKIQTQEWYIVQDADRLDAIWAIGIARCFAYWWSKDKLLRDPEEETVLHQDSKAYIYSNVSSIGHFYEKLLLLKDKINTKTWKNIAQERHNYMEWYLQQFFAEREWKK